MKITSAEFLKSVTINDEKVYFDARNEVVFIGRSNVWKSSLMNALLQKKDLVKTSSKPWKTRNANMFFVNEKYFFTDLPGYGFAKMGQEKRKDMDSLISWYLEERKIYIKRVIILIDSKIGAQETDIDMYKYVTEHHMNPLIVLAKTDRLSNNEVQKSVKHAQGIFFGQEIIAVSAEKWDGIEKLRKIIGESLKNS
jgi:GTP-binding protein